LNHPNFEVSPFILALVGRAIHSNGRDLDGAVNRLLAHWTLTDATLNVESAELAIRISSARMKPSESKSRISKNWSLPTQRDAPRHYLIPSNRDRRQSEADRDVSG
jgi:hypothetical protein